MEVNGKKLVGFIVEVKAEKVRIFLNNLNDTWIEKQVLLDLFQILK